MEKNASSRPKNLLTLMDPVRAADPSFFNKLDFHHLLRVERMRTERSKKPFLLLLLDISRLIETSQDEKAVNKVKEALKPSLREIDMRGWYNNNRIIGVLLTEIEQIDEAFIDTMIHKIFNRFHERLNPNWIKKIDISYHVFPETKQGLLADEPFNIKLYPDLVKKDFNRKISLFIKNNLFDTLGSVLGLLLFSPLFLIIALAIKATSPGPVFFRQERVGLNGKTFLFYKFRSMTENNDPCTHKEYISRFINQQIRRQSNRGYSN